MALKMKTAEVTTIARVKRFYRCPHCGERFAQRQGEWCENCRRAGDLPLVGAFTARPASAIAPELPPLAGPSPGVLKRPEAIGSELVHATGSRGIRGPAWAAVLREQDQVVWECCHVHETREGALECAYQARGVWLKEEDNDG